MGGEELSKRWVRGVVIAIATVFGLSLFTVAAPQAHAVACVSVRFEADKEARPTANVEEGDIITHIIDIEMFSVLPPAECGPVTVEVQDFAPGQTFVSASGAACTASGSTTTCTYTENALPGGAPQRIEIQYRAGPPPATGRYCDGGVVFSTTAAPVPTAFGPACANAAEPPTPPPDGGGGGFDGDEDFDNGGFGDGGFGNFGTGFGTTTPLGGVDTGAGGTARSNAAVPQIALGSLLAIGFLLLALRRFRRA